MTLSKEHLDSSAQYVRTTNGKAISYEGFLKQTVGNTCAEICIIF